MAETNTPEIDPDLDDTVAANRALHQGLGLGAREIRSQEDPDGSGAGTPDGEGGADGVERTEPETDREGT